MLARVLKIAAGMVAFLLFVISLQIWSPRFLTDRAYRTLPPSDPICATPVQIASIRNDETRISGDAWKCSVQSHVFDTTDDAGAPAQRRFRLAFLELNAEGGLHRPEQLENLKKLLSRPNLFVVTFVHGWRHDAARGDGNLRTFRTLLAYSSQFLAQRHSAAELVGVFVSWPARPPLDCSYGPCGYLVAPSILTLKPRSDALAQPITEAIRAIDEVVRENSDARSPSRTLVVGHSLGGNALIDGIAPNAIEKIAGHKSREILPPLLGDLTVLLNPASEARKWAKLQKAVRSANGLKDGDISRFGAEDEDAVKAHERFPIHQPPRLISITSACDWLNPKSDKPEALPKCDSNTATHFRWYRQFQRREMTCRDETDCTAIGHYKPTNRKQEKTDEEKRKRVNFGTTHEVDMTVRAPQLSPTDAIVKQGARGTNFTNVVVQQKSRCEVVEGWLSKAIGAASKRVNNKFGQFWTSETSVEDLTPINKQLGITAGVHHSIYNGKDDYAITASSDPFWNARANDSALIGHNGFGSYPLWCLINQMVLDDIVKR